VSALGIEDVRLRRVRRPYLLDGIKESRYTEHSSQIGESTDEYVYKRSFIPIGPGMGATELLDSNAVYVVPLNGDPIP
jgi:hypothetical protein